MATDILETPLSDKITRGSKGGPFGARIKTYTAGGRLKQKFLRSLPLQRYDISYGIRTLADFEDVRSAFYVVMFTPYPGLRLRDWADYQGTRTNTTLTNISGTIWQLQRAYTFGSVTIKRDIKKPRSGVVIYDAAGSPLTATVDTTDGTANVTGTPATWAGLFDVPVTFVDDSMEDINIDGSSMNILQGLPSILLEEIRL